MIELGDGDDIASLNELHRPIALVLNAHEAVPASWQVPKDLPVCGSA